ncbi:DNA replication complex GINS protein PSF2-like [Mytilus californianus]|uniref:DNA replication complex GINS protein PSF2 n=3 Tax=Mytilus TaxID=6548 RepID=A0A8B6FMS5_MYTGA|nr:DNA replication complex GINS protein PSF2-like [Mytilus californianus]CAC5387347.1 GINS2 [Mytilus coruscus]CAG2252885.1 GINS2 [Mytilus edulis]VDI52057.1 GINS complex subunit 2 [Mytilus galloprovincialis]
MDPAEVEFLAEKEEISVVPNFTQDKIYLIGGDVGPFNAGLPVKVPLWMAINLKQGQKCRIIPPDWMDTERLQDKKQEETDSKFFTEMPSPHFMEITQLLLKCATDDIPHADEIRTLVKDIWDLRIAKLRSSIDTFLKSDATHAKLNYLTLMELNTARPFLTKALDQMHLLRSNLSGRIQSTQE